MPSIADNIKSMAALVAEVKKDHRLSEGTVMRIVDMNFALAQGAGINSLGGDEDLSILEADDTIPFPTPEQMTLFDGEDTTVETEDEVLATVEHKEMN